MNIVQTHTLEQAEKHLQQLPIEEQQKIFSLIDELVQKHQANNEKRQFGLYQDKGHFKLRDDFKMTEQELFE